MEWDLGLRGIGLLVAMAMGFGLIAQMLMWRVTTHWLWLIAASAYFLSGVVVSEIWFGWATEDDLRPNIDGLSFDEVLLLATTAGILAVLGAWLISLRTSPDLVVRDAGRSSSDRWPWSCARSKANDPMRG